MPEPTNKQSAVQAAVAAQAAPPAAPPDNAVASQISAKELEEPSLDVQKHMARSAASVGHRRMFNDLNNFNIVAKPLSCGDGFFNLIPKNPDIIFRAVCSTVNTNDGPSFLRYEQAKSQGYINATIADVQGTVPASYIKDNGARIMNGDLILMKMDKTTYRGALKWKDQQAIRATRRSTTVDQGKSEIAKAMQETNMPHKLGRKLSPFSPTADEIKKDFGDNQ